ncbi:TraK domain-containing protein [Methylobacter luteus]|uniref:TraK domain-containing protein n=1 Tax=Methylobacter luteus TaxID=415 RepID=UPI000429B27D|nr:type-F conjugative transfer system secretin TraK [Methylobacter luteus]
MQVKTLIFSMALATTALANDMPPELPFQAQDGSSLTPYQDGEAGDLGVSDSKPALPVPPAPDTAPPSSGQVINGTPETPTVAQPETVEPAPRPKLKKRPKILDKAPTAQKAQAEMNVPDSVPGLQSGITLKPKPGRTESVIIAKGRLNRIVTPYPEPKVLTVDPVETKIDGSAVYIATDSEAPVSLFISDTETGSATSLQLAPQDMAMPVEIRIEGGPVQANSTEAASSKTDKLFRQDTPYITEMKAIMQNLGKQQIPQGFTLEEVTEELHGITFCHDPSLTYWPGQLLSGHESRIVVLIAQNNGASTAVFEEASCASDDTMAVAAWPKVRLEPGEKTEIYLLMRLPDGKSGEEIRPALL